MGLEAGALWEPRTEWAIGKDFMGVLTLELGCDI